MMSRGEGFRKRARKFVKREMNLLISVTEHGSVVNSGSLCVIDPPHKN